MSDVELDVLDLKDMVLSNNSFGPSDVGAIRSAVSENYGHFGELRDAASVIGRERALGRALMGVREKYDYILVDEPPSLGLLTINGLTAATELLVPIQCEYYALEGLSALLSTIEQIRDTVNPQLELYGILRTMYDPRINLSNEVSLQLIKHFDRKVFRTVIPRNIRLAEAPSFGRPVLLHDRSSRGAISYLALAGEVLRREDARENHLKAV